MLDKIYDNDLLYIIWLELKICYGLFGFKGIYYCNGI